MAKGIIVFGASGCGTTTIGKELARQLGFRHFDLDDYYWRWDTDIPFTVPRTREERKALLGEHLESCSSFVFSGSLGMWSEPFVPLLDLAVFVTVPVRVRLERLHRRELERFGERILAGGDMYEAHIEFMDWSAEYDTMEPPERCLKLHKEWSAGLSCPLLEIDGSIGVAENAAEIIEAYKKAKQSVV